MNIYIDSRSGAPIYDQIYSQIKRQIVSGEFSADDPLPSIRTLAKELRISVITTKRAYEELEREGYIYTLAGKGSFVAHRSAELLQRECLAKIEGYMQNIRELAELCRIGRDEIEKMLNEVMEEKHERIGNTGSDETV